MDLASLFPDLKPWVQSLATTWPVPLIKSSTWMFSVIQSLHLLALAALGGCILLPNLRLMGVGMTSVPAASIEKTVRPWLWGALIVLAITGVLMGMVIAPRLYARPAFLIKMIALAAALVLSLGVVGPVAKRDGVIGLTTKILAGIAVLLWLFAIYLFGTSFGPAPGTFHIVCAGWLIVMVFGSRLTRIVLGAITAVAVVGVGFVTYGIYDPLDNYDIVMEINRWAVRLMALLVAGFLVWEFAIAKRERPAGPALARMIGLFTILAWVTVATAGRWIGLGGSGG
jgi:hypothetical protein